MKFDMMSHECQTDSSVD